LPASGDEHAVLDVVGTAIVGHLKLSDLGGERLGAPHADGGGLDAVGS
jgi:hypothetical protein